MRTHCWLTPSSALHGASCPKQEKTPAAPLPSRDTHQGTTAPATPGALAAQAMLKEQQQCRLKDITGSSMGKMFVRAEALLPAHGGAQCSIWHCD